MDEKVVRLVNRVSHHYHYHYHISIYHYHIGFQHDHYEYHNYINAVTFTITPLF